MRAAYVDTSCLVAIAFAEPGHERLAADLDSYDELLSSNLLEAELRSALVREQVDADVGPLTSRISCVYPDRTLTAEFGVVLESGHLRGADLWHLAVALYVDPRHEIDFLTLDARQRQVSRRVGFGVR